MWASASGTATTSSLTEAGSAAAGSAGAGPGVECIKVPYGLGLRVCG